MFLSHTENSNKNFFLKQYWNGHTMDYESYLDIWISM